MSELKRRKCRECRELFCPEPRSRKSQQYCSKAPCRSSSKAASQKRWLSKPENRNYFCGPEHVERVRLWRAKHPGYWRRCGQSTLQDVCTSQGTETTNESVDFPVTALQDIISAQPYVIIGLIANLAGTALQDDIASAGRKLLRLGQDIVAGKSDDQKTNIVPPQSALYAKAVQLARPAAGP